MTDLASLVSLVLNLHWHDEQHRGMQVLGRSVVWCSDIRGMLEGRLLLLGGAVVITDCRYQVEDRERRGNVWKVNESHEKVTTPQQNSQHPDARDRCAV